MNNNQGWYCNQEVFRQGPISRSESIRQLTLKMSELIICNKIICLTIIVQSIELQ